MRLVGASSSVVSSRFADAAAAGGSSSSPQAPPPPTTIADGSQAIPYFGQTNYVIETENFTVISGEWEARAWAHSPGYFASNSANDFMSRRAYLHAPAHAINSTIAASNAAIQEAGTYTVLLRYEALYRFETPVLVTVSQAGKQLLSRVYGQRSSLKVWGYPYGHNMVCAGLVAECLWPWGSTDNTVWEGVGVTVPLQPGTATVTLEVVRTTSPVPLDGAKVRFADRNVDVVMLSPNASDINMRMSHEFGEVPFDGLLSQAGEVHFQVSNYGLTNFSLLIPRIYGHGAGWWEGGHLAAPLKTAAGTIMNGCTSAGGPACPTITVDAGQTSPWTDVGAEVSRTLSTHATVLVFGSPGGGGGSPGSTQILRGTRLTDGCATTRNVEFNRPLP